MEDKYRPYTEEEFDKLFYQSGIDEIAKDYCRKELEEWMEIVKKNPLKNFKTFREEAWYDVLRFSHPNVYAEQRKTGQSHEWSKAFAEATESYEGRDDKLYMCIQESFDSLEEQERDKELTLFFDNFSDDPVYNRICKKYFWEVNEDVWLKLSQQYAAEFHKCVANDKSNIFAEAYADKATSNYPEKDRTIYATAFESAVNHGYDSWRASSFADYFVEVHKFGCPKLAYPKTIINLEEDWQNDLYNQLIDEPSA